MRTYRPIWEAIKATNKAEITLSKDRVATVIQGVKKIKSEENAIRPRVGLMRFSRLKIAQETLSERTGMVKVTFTLYYDIKI